MPGDMLQNAIDTFYDTVGYLLDDSMTLPIHEGPLILILGGSAMLALSLFLSLLLQGRRTGSPFVASNGSPQAIYPHHLHRPALSARPASGTGGRRGASRATPNTSIDSTSETQTLPRPTSSARTPARRRRVPRRWLRTLKKTAKRAGLGQVRHLVAPGGRHAVQLSRCRTCRSPRYAGTGCEWERGLLQRALQHNDPQVRVTELHCDPRNGGRCRFEIHPGGTRA